MSSNAIAAGGTTLSYGNQIGTSGTVYTRVAEVVDITGPSLSADTEDVSSHDSFIDEGGWEDHIVTLLRSGEVTFDINYIPGDASHDATSGVLSIFNDSEKRNWKIEFPDASGTTWDFNAYVTGFEPSAPHDGELNASLTLKITDQPSLT